MQHAYAPEISDAPHARGATTGSGYYSRSSKKRPTVGRNRTFAVVFYSCPSRAGNILHVFWNQVLLSVATNRTLLLKYADFITCQQFLEHTGFGACGRDHSEENCSNFLRKAPWMASYDDWKDSIDKPHSFTRENVRLALKGTGGIDVHSKFPSK